jgi:hypothetical protein
MEVYVVVSVSKLVVVTVGVTVIQVVDVEVLRSGLMRLLSEDLTWY